MNILDIQYDFYDKNLYIYCDNNPVSRIDESGNMWIEISLADAGIAGVSSGYTLGAIGGSILAGLGAITPIGWVVIAIGVVTVISAVVITVEKPINEQRIISGVTAKSKQK